MRTRLTWLAAAAFLFLSGYWTGRRDLVTVHAQQGYKRDFVVPKAWGPLRGVYNDQLLFEDEHGVIRSVYPNGGVVVFSVARR